MRREPGTQTEWQILKLCLFLSRWRTGQQSPRTGSQHQQQWLARDAKGGQASQEITISPRVQAQAWGRETPRSRLPLHSPRASGHGRPGCMFSAGRTPDHRAPTNPAITAASASLRTIKCACPVAKTSEQALPGSGSAMQCLSDLGQVLSNGQDSPSSKPWQQHQPECVAVVSKPCEATVNASCTLPSFGRQSFAPSKCRVEQSRDYGDKGTGRWG